MCLGTVKVSPRLEHQSSGRHALGREEEVCRELLEVNPRQPRGDDWSRKKIDSLPLFSACKGQDTEGYALIGKNWFLAIDRDEAQDRSGYASSGAKPRLGAQHGSGAGSPRRQPATPAWGLGFGVWGLGSGVWGLRLGLGFGV